MIRIALYATSLVVELHDVRLAPRHESQLVHWGFHFNARGDSFEVQTQRTDNIAHKVTSYFQKHNLPYELTPDVEHLVTHWHTAASELACAMNRGASLKNGVIEKALLREFVLFLRNNVKRRLKSHQFKAALHLFGVRNGANFSVPGSGKTAVVLTVFQRLRLLGKVDALLVVGPPSCFWPWQQEYEEVLGTTPNSAIMAGGNVDERRARYCITRQTACDLYLTTFQTLQRDCENVELMLKCQGIRFYLVIDEAHYVKQADGAWANAVLKIAPHAARRCVLTGTPFPRSYVDAFNLFDFLWPEHPPLSDQTKHHIQLLTEQKLHDDVIRVFDSAIGGLFYRVRKTDLGLAAQHHHVMSVTMSTYERLLYDSVLDRIRDISRSDYFRNIDLLLRLRRGRMMRLRQCVSYVRLLRTAIKEYGEAVLPDDPSLTDIVTHYDTLERPAKLAALMEIVQRLRDDGQKVVIWSNFVETLKLIRAAIRRCGYKAHLIYGATPTERENVQLELTREEIIRDFVERDGGTDILIANPAACAESISLHKTCSNAIYYDLSYNSAQYIQSMDRIHRVGGSEHVPAHYYVLQYADTIERDILSNVHSKVDNMAAIVDRDYPLYSLDMFADEEELDAYARLFAR